MTNINSGVTVRAMQGDTVDKLCWRHFGETRGITEQVLALNPGLSGHVTLPAGTAVVLPIQTAPSTKPLIQLWD